MLLSTIVNLGFKILLFSCSSLLAYDLLIKLFTRAREDFFDVLAGLCASLKAFVDAILASEFDSTALRSG